MSSASKKNILGRLGLALFVVLAILPIGFSIVYAAAYSLGLAGLLSDGLTVRHWQVLYESAEIVSSFGLSMYIAGSTVVITLAAALIITLSLRSSLQRGSLSYAIYLPLAIPAVVAAFITFQLFSGAGFLARIAINLGWISEIGQIPEMINDAFGIGIIIAHVFLATPFFTLLFNEIYSTENIEGLSQLGSTLGASSGQLLYRVKIPILLNRGATNLVLLFISVLGSYEIPLLLGRQAPQMVSVLALRKYQMFDISEKPEAFIVALLYTLIVLVLIAFIFRRKPDDFDV